jgi:hypothetical protein
MKTKFLYSSIVLFVSLGLFLGFKISEDIHGSKVSSSKSDYVSVQYSTDNVPVYTDDFDGDNTPVGLALRGYKVINNSQPVGTSTWFQGGTGVGTPPAFNGPTTGYVGCNYLSTSGGPSGGEGIIDNWLIFPRIAGGIQAGDSLTFWARSSTVATPPNVNYPDSARIYYSANGDSTVAGTWVELGRFKFINPAAGAPNNGYEKKGFRAATSGANGRFAIVYHVNNAGPTGANSDYICIDAARIERTSTPPPTPTTWFEHTTPLSAGTLASVSAADDNNVWAAGYVSNASGPPLVIRTTNGGTYTNALGTGIGAAVPIFNIWAIDGNTALATGSTTSTFVYKTTNGGTTWSTVFTQSGGFINVITMKDANTGFMQGDPVGGRWSLFRTTNGGTTWDSTGMYLPQAGTEAGWNNAISTVGDNIWFGTNNTKVYRSTNFGMSWTAQVPTGVAGASGSDVHFNDANNGMYGGASLVTTTNGGTTWTANAGSGTGNYSGITGYGSNWWTVRFSAAVGFSSNNGTAWSVAYTTTSGTVADITKSRTGLFLYGSKNNGGMIKYGITTGINPVGGEVVKNYSLSQNYPNPFNPTTNIKFAIPSNGLVSLKVYNMLGKEVATLVNGNLSAGAYTYDFNASNLASGVYFYKLESANFSEVKKMMLVK